MTTVLGTTWEQPGSNKQRYLFGDGWSDDGDDSVTAKRENVMRARTDRVQKLKTYDEFPNRWGILNYIV